MGEDTPQNRHCRIRHAAWSPYVPEALLRERAAQVEAGQVSTRTVEEIFSAAIDKASNGPDA